jgi:MinD superfamily P-loop ATPase
METVKEIVVISGKGGTGKTSLVAALDSLFTDKVMVDCDVDAANLHLILSPEKIIRHSAFPGGKKAAIDLARCTGCGVCRDVCRFGAISSDFIVDQFYCEGCGACYLLCPAHAVNFLPHTAGHWYVSETRNNGRFVFAELQPGEDNSGKLVAAVRNEARVEAEATGKRLIIIDGPPGIGCPVISSVTGTNRAIVVTEPTPTGVHDLERVVALANHFRIRAAVVVNKCDINPSWLTAIKEYCDRSSLTLLGEIPYETAMTEAQREGKAIVDYSPGCDSSNAIRAIHSKLQTILEEL